MTIFTINDKEYNSTQLFEFITMQDQQCYVEQLLKYFIGVTLKNQLVSITRSEYPLFEYEADQFLEG